MNIFHVNGSSIDLCFFFYMHQFFGGTNFGRTSGGPNYVTSYDYDAPLDEYGKIQVCISITFTYSQRVLICVFLLISALTLTRISLYLGLLSQPKWGHLKDLHATIKLCEPALVAADSAQYIKLGSSQEVCSSPLLLSTNL